VTALFAAGGSFAPASPTYAGDASFVYAGDTTQAGTYAVNVSSSATQATDSGAALASGSVSAAETLTVGQGTTTASYTTTAGESLNAIATGLNAQFAIGGQTMAASVVDDGAKLELSSSAYGSDASFTVASSNTAAGTTGLGASASAYAGTDVAGTIDGVAATGNGQTLSAPSSDPTLAGLSLEVSAQGITSPTSIGSFSYNPGLAQQLQALASSASDPTTGTISTTIKGLSSQATGLNTQIANYQAVEDKQQTLLQAEFATMESTLGGLKNESSELTSAINQL
jgi:flagellar hook-associated protein 2